MDVRHDVISRLEGGSVDYYVTGSEALAVHGVAYRSTNDIDIVLGLTSEEYEPRIRPLFEPDYLVSDLLRITPRWFGSVVSTTGIGKADLIIRDPDSWGREALSRRLQINDPGLGLAWVSTAEDLLIAKLDWSEGKLDGLQGRDAVRLIQTVPDLDLRYVRRQLAALNVVDRLDLILARA